VQHGNKARIPDEIIDEAMATIKGVGVDALVCIGGDGSLSTSLQLFESGIGVVGVPKTIDNDLSATSMTFGFDSAVACVVDAMDRLHTTAISHKRVMVVEVMGRYAGWIALYGGLAGGADAILIPEIPYNPQVLTDLIKQREANGHFSTMVVVAEGARENGKDFMTISSQARAGEARLGGIGEYVSHHIAESTGKETRHVVLGHLQRGGAPTALDRILGTRFGVEAVELIDQGKLGHMVSYHDNRIGSVPIEEAVSKIRLVEPDDQMVHGCRKIGICFGDTLPL
jgi:6-phosphofructokinase 1